MFFSWIKKALLGVFGKYGLWEDEIHHACVFSEMSGFT
jgi:hypothetical protein